jgi:hypothetical protein
MNRSPCHGCATTRVPEILHNLKADPLISKMDLRLVIEATTLSSSDIGGLPGLQQLLKQPNVEINASTIWEEFEQILKQYDQFYDKVTTEH